MSTIFGSTEDEDFSTKEFKIKNIYEINYSMIQDIINIIQPSSFVNNIEITDINKNVLGVYVYYINNNIEYDNKYLLKIYENLDIELKRFDRFNHTYVYIPIKNCMKLFSYLNNKISYILK